MTQKPLNDHIEYLAKILGRPVTRRTMKIIVIHLHATAAVNHAFSQKSALCTEDIIYLS